MQSHGLWHASPITQFPLFELCMQPIMVELPQACKQVLLCQRASSKGWGEHESPGMRQQGNISGERDGPPKNEKKHIADKLKEKLVIGPSRRVSSCL